MVVLFAENQDCIMKGLTKKQIQKAKFVAQQEENFGGFCKSCGKAVQPVVTGGVKLLGVCLFDGKKHEVQDKLYEFGPRGFASLPAKQRSEIARMGGKANAKQGIKNPFTSESARAATLKRHIKAGHKISASIETA